MGPIQHRSAGVVAPQQHTETRFLSSSGSHSDMRADLILDGSHRAHVSHPHVSFDESRDLQLGRSPIRLPVLFQCLRNYENRIDALILENGFRSGFKIEYNGTRTAVEYKNLKSAIDNEIVLLEKICQEVQLGRIAGPFAKPPLSNLRVSPV